MSFINSSDFWNMVNTPTGFYPNADGSISYNDNVLNNWFNPSLTGNQQYVLEWNRDNQRYQQEWDQYLKEYEYNKSLSERQQALSEESYYNGIRNQASQLASLGINPATEGSSLSSSAMSGGSSVGSTRPSGSPSAGRSALGSQIFNMLGTLISLGSGISQMKLNDASARNLDADTSVKNAQASYNEALATSAMYRAMLDKGDLEFLEGLQMSDKEYRSLANLRITADSAVSVGAKLGLNLSLKMFGVGSSVDGSVEGTYSSGTSVLVSGDSLVTLIHGMNSNIKGSDIYKAIMDYSDLPDSSGSRPVNVPADWKYVRDSKDSYVFETSSGRTVYIGK